MCSLHLKSVTATLWNWGLLLLPACYRNMIIKCFIEEVKASNNSCKLTDLLFVCFFLCYFYSRSLYCFNQSLCCFLREKVSGSEKSRLLGGSEWCGKMVAQTTSQGLFEMTTVCLNTGFESCSPLADGRR